MIPTLFGFPLWYGKIKNRVAKKYLIHNLRIKDYINPVSQLKVGDFVRNCSGFNIKIAKLTPEYFRVGKGFVLYDVEIINSNGGCCSFINCSIEPALPRDKIIERYEKMLEYWKANVDEWNFVKRYNCTTVDENGVATVDWLAYDKSLYA